MHFYNTNNHHCTQSIDHLKVISGQQFSHSQDYSQWEDYFQRKSIGYLPNQNKEFFLI